MGVKESVTQAQRNNSAIETSRFDVTRFRQDFPMLSAKIDNKPLIYLIQQARLPLLKVFSQTEPG
jgi:hypothetical protein